ncbi:polysaccharide pyruvyl transferase family protein [Xanthobacter sediminis]
MRARTATLGAVPLVWAAATADQSHLNLGDALSPVMVALLSSLPVVHAGHAIRGTRMAAVGTIGHMLRNGDITVWGTGASRYCNPHATPRAARVPFVPQPGTRYRVAATRGPVTRALFKEENAVGPAVFGDPVWLLPQFYRPPVEKKWELGVIVHLSELDGSGVESIVRRELRRYHVPDELRDTVRIIHTRTAISADALRERLDEILACRRLVSTSLHGMVFAESYGIPCLYFAPRGERRGLCVRPLDPDDGNDLRITDLYQGLGLDKIPVYVQPRWRYTHWLKLMRTIDHVWEPKPFDAEPLVSAFPLEVAPLHPQPGETIFDHPLIRDIPFQQAVFARREGDAARPGLRSLARRLMKPMTGRRAGAGTPPQTPDQQ